MEVALIGSGGTARAVGRNLLAAGHQLTLFDPAPEKAKDLTDAGATIATRLRDACNADAVVTVLSSARSLEEIVLGPNGVVAVMPAGTVHVSMSTISVALSRRLAAAHEERIQRYMAAPLLGGPDAAARSELCIFAGGRADIRSYCQSLFDAIARHTLEVSENPAEANLLQLCALGLIGSLIESLGEAVTLAAHGGIAPHRFLKLMSGSLFGEGLHASYGSLLNAEARPPRLLTVTQACHIARLLLESAKGVGAVTPLVNLLLDRLQALEQVGMGEVDWLAHSILASGGENKDHR